MKAFFLVFFAGGVGSALRYAVQLALQGRVQPVQFPWATFAVNLLGCFLIGLFHALSSRLQLSPETLCFARDMSLRLPVISASVSSLGLGPYGPETRWRVRFRVAAICYNGAHEQ